ncbi:MAG: Transcriptional regulator [uncultured Gemmatimonadetes bacterium]|uniref:Transcriptional regulator n=1 Tax=uncultured Gemmatimonadota bacterium TaxID=203437 RepID=A0A6J4KYB7_9BACT|nr:MAG: Transcriptional regulator [uncultured Gemmatimonadota bacterium]
MNVSLAYGRGRIDVAVPDDAVVICPRELPGLADERAAFLDAVRRPIGAAPLRSLATAESTVAIAISDITRPTPSERLVPWILAELAHVPRGNFVILNGTGSHRPNTRAELVTMLGAEVVDTVRVVNHDAFAETGLTHLGDTSYGGEVWVSDEWLRADVRIVTGFVEPHFFAGFSGGPKGVVPALAGIRTIKHLHNAQMIGDPRSTWARLEGNPVQGEIREAVAMAPPHFLVNVAINSRRGITAVWAGHYLRAHEEACRFVATHAMRAVDRAFDVVLSSNSGYPLDQNVYQSVKGMSAAARIVKPGGAIVVAAECSDGLPEHGNYKQLLRMRATSEELLRAIEEPGFEMHDQWQAQSQALVQRKAEVHLFSSLPPDTVRAAMLTPCADLEATLASLLRRYGPGARMAVLPEGPQTVPYVEAGAESPSPPDPLSR